MDDGWKHTTRSLGLLRPHNQCSIVREALHVFLMQRLCVARAIEIFHKCHEGGAAGWREGGVVSDLVGHYGGLIN